MRIRLICCFALSGPAVFGQTMFSFSAQADRDTTTITMRALRLPGMRAVTGAPYTADQISEHTQTLSDGTRITQNHTIMHLARDSQGRTRTERPLFGGPFASAQDAHEVMLVEIWDPVAGFAYVLDDQNRIAHRAELPQAPPPPSRPASAGTVVGRIVTPGGSGPQRSGPEKLGTQVIEGVLAEGTRTTTTWPTGSQGNDRPMTDTMETWYSQELKRMVLVKNVSARNGENITRMEDISRSEPDPALFQPPADYTVVDEKDTFTMTLKR